MPGHLLTLLGWWSLVQVLLHVKTLGHDGHQGALGPRDEVKLLEVGTKYLNLFTLLSILLYARSNRDTAGLLCPLVGTGVGVLVSP